MNYTRPNDEEHNDNANDWLSTSLIFASALGKILKEDEGIVVKIRGDMNVGLSWLLDDVKSVIVYSKENQIHIMEGGEHLENGNMVWLHADMGDFSDFTPD